MAKDILFSAISVLSQTLTCLMFLVIHLFYEKDIRSRNFCDNYSIYKREMQTIPNKICQAAVFQIFPIIL